MYYCEAIDCYYLLSIGDRREERKNKLWIVFVKGSQCTNFFDNLPDDAIAKKLQNLINYTLISVLSCEDFEKGKHYKNTQFRIIGYKI